MTLKGFTVVSPVKQWTNRKNAPPTKYGYPVFALRLHPLSWTMCGKPILSACNPSERKSTKKSQNGSDKETTDVIPTSKASLKILHYQTNKQLTIGWKLLKSFWWKIVGNCGEKYLLLRSLIIIRWNDTFFRQYWSKGGHRRKEFYPRPIQTATTVRLWRQAHHAQRRISRLLIVLYPEREVWNEELDELRQRLNK